MKRTAVMSPPWLTLSKHHNNNSIVNKKLGWDMYIDTDNIKQLEPNPPFKFLKNGAIDSNMSIKYYKSDVHISKIDNNIDIVVLCNYNDKKRNIKTHSELKFKGYDFNKLMYEFYNIFFKVNFKTSKNVKKCAKNILDKLELNNYTFIHIRRGDFLYNKTLAPPHGSYPYTTPQFVANVLKKRNQKNIFIASNEKDKKYYQQIKELLPDFNIINENEILKYIPKELLNDNYFIYQVSHEIALKSNYNIGTVGYVRLGQNYNIKLSEVYNLTY